ncbi:MAG: hypothetical protein ABIJ74_00845 [archaeon]
MPDNSTDFMSISINTEFIPYAINLQDKKPVELNIEVINRYNAPKKVNLEITATNQIGFNKTLSSIEKFELGLIKPGENRVVKVSVAPKNFAAKGEEKISIMATEITVEETGYSYPSKKFRKLIDIKLK